MVLIEQIERRVLADRQVAATLAAAGAHLDLPDPDEARRQFDLALVDEGASSRERVLMAALGMA